MRIALAEAGVAADWHNVWDDRAAGEFVRSVANGCETVPTVVIDGHALVAPSPRALGEIERVAPGLVQRHRRWPPFRVVQWTVETSLVAAGTMVASAGDEAWSYLLNGAAILAYAGLRRLRARSSGGSEAIAMRAGSLRVASSTTIERAPDLLVVGGGAGGLAAARAATRGGAHVLLVQRGPLGGDCTFTGCVPSRR